jgi:hypothetical protein
MLDVTTPQTVRINTRIVAIDDERNVALKIKERHICICPHNSNKIIMIPLAVSVNNSRPVKYPVIIKIADDIQ